MGRQRKRACLEQGLSLDINFLSRSRIIEFGNVRFSRSIRWGVPPDYFASGSISAELIGPSGWLQVQIGENTQRIEVVSEPRHFGGCQKYFVCPKTGRKASVMWQPPGAHEFRSRQGWGNSVAYITQIGSWVDRAHRGKEKIKNILLADEDPDKWDLPPKPKWMRVKTYENYVRRFDHYEAALAQGPDGKSMMSRPK